jgi:transposase
MKNWWKLHACIDVKTQTFLSWEITDPSVYDAHMLPALLSELQAEIGDVYADAAYLSSENCWEVALHGGEPFLRPRSTTKGSDHRRKGKNRICPPFLTMVDSYFADREAWMKRYARRNTVESAFGGLKRRFGAGVRASRRWMHRTSVLVTCLDRAVPWVSRRVCAVAPARSAAARRAHARRRCVPTRRW